MRLAEATRPAHERVERELALDGVMPLARYHAYLQGMHAVLHAVEPQLEDVTALAGLAMHARRKLPWLERDLAYYGLAQLEAQPVAVGCDAASRLGWAYVMEGSTLGGRVLYRSLAARWPLTPERGGAFLWGYGERTGQMWHGFVDALNAMALTALERERCIAAAIEAFEAVGAALRASIARAGLGLDGDDLAA